MLHIYCIRSNMDAYIRLSEVVAIQPWERLERKGHWWQGSVYVPFGTRIFMSGGHTFVVEDSPDTVRGWLDAALLD